MAHLSQGLYHLHQRKRIYRNHQPFPHSNLWVRRLDGVVYFMTFFTLAMTLPQIVEIWVRKSAVSISIISWIAYFINASVWLVYGIVHKEKPIIIGNVLWMVFQMLIIIGAWMYGGRLF